MNKLLLYCIVLWWTYYCNSFSKPTLIITYSDIFLCTIYLYSTTINDPKKIAAVYYILSIYSYRRHKGKGAIKRTNAKQCTLSEIVVFWNIELLFSDIFRIMIHLSVLLVRELPAFWTHLHQQLQQLTKLSPGYVNHENKLINI